MIDLIPSSLTLSGEFLLCQPKDGQTWLQVRFAGETVWLSLNQLAELKVHA